MYDLFVNVSRLPVWQELLMGYLVVLNLTSEFDICMNVFYFMLRGNRKLGALAIVVKALKFM